MEKVAYKSKPPSNVPRSKLALIKLTPSSRVSNAEIEPLSVPNYRKFLNSPMMTLIQSIYIRTDNIRTLVTIVYLKKMFEITI